MATNNANCRGGALGAVWWQGAQWAVTEHGLECRDGTYFIDKNRLLENEDYPWPLHMSGKLWINIDEFTTAWIVALVLHELAGAIKPEKLRQLFAQLPPVGERGWDNG